MYATIPVYYPSLEEAARKDEAALWCDSYNINMSCRNFIQDKARAVNSDNQLYRQAGNSVTVPVIYAIGKQILAAQKALECGE